MCTRKWTACNRSCFKNLCDTCGDWKGKLDELFSSVPKEDTDKFAWYTWERKEYIRKNGLKGFCRELVLRDKTFKAFKEEFYNDIKNPLERCTFAEHFFAKNIKKICLLNVDHH